MSVPYPTQFTIERYTIRESPVAYRIYLDGEPYLDCWPGGTGPCWNVRNADDPDAEPLHICDLGEMMDALHFLLGSNPHAENVKRWS